MPTTNFIYEYYQAIKDEKVVVGLWIKLLYEYIIHGLENKSFYYDNKKASRAIKWIENYCHHCKGRNDLFKLELWQKALVSLIFGIVDGSGARQFREVALIVARKNGKSLLAASIISYMAFLDGEYGPEIFCIAPKVEQADIVYNSFWQMTQLEPELKSRIKSRKGDYYIAETNASIRKIAFNAKKSDGFNPHLVVMDEIAAWVGDQGKKVYEVMKSACGSRKQPLILSCSTSGYINDGIFDEIVMRGTKLLQGDSKETRFLPVFYMIDDIDKWNDINELQKSNPNLGISISLDYMLEEINIAEGSLSKKAEFITKYCNLKQNSSVAWLPAQAIEKACSTKHYTFEDFKSSYCVAGIDLSQTTDLTSACLLIEKDKELYVVSHFWLPGEKISDAMARDGVPYTEMIERGFLSASGDNFVDYHDVYNWLIEAVEKYELLPLMIGYDRYSAQYLIQDLKTYGFQVDDVYQGVNLTPVLNEMSGIIRDGKVHIGDNDLLKIHLLDSAIEQDVHVNKIRLKKVARNAHIDGVAALADAFCVRQKYYADLGERLQNK